MPAVSRLGGVVDRAWPRLAVALLGAAALVALLGLVLAPRESPADRVRDAVSDFAGAVERRQGTQACGLLTPAAQLATAQRTGTLDCARTIQTFGAGIDTAGLADARIAKVTVTGPTATIAASDVLRGDGSPLGLAITLQQVLGHWRIAGVQGVPAPAAG